MDDFKDFVLKPTSRKILEYLVAHQGEELRSDDIALELGMKKVAVDAAVTRTLVRRTLARREARLTELRKKMYNIIKVTQRGCDYIDWLRDQEAIQQATME